MILNLHAHEEGISYDKFCIYKQMNVKNPGRKENKDQRSRTERIERMANSYSKDRILEYLRGISYKH